MLEMNVKNHSVAYQDTQGNNQTIVLLHGWGQSTELMKPIYEHFKNDFRMINIDLPGFGHSDELKETWGVFEYTEFLHDFLDTLEISNPIFIAHSFGARIAIMYASKYQTKQLVLTGAAGIKPKKSFVTKSKIATYKVAKKLVKLPGLNRFEDSLKKYFGSSDYKNTSGFKRSSFVKIVNEDLTDLLKEIEAPTLLIWGENDDATPLWMGKIMESKIPDAGLVVFENDDHYAYFHQMQRFNTIVNVFLRNLKENN